VSFQLEARGEFWALRGARSSVGRGEGGPPGPRDTFEITIHDPTISSRHAVLHVDNLARSVVVEDTGSTNGTYVNDSHIGFNGRRDLRDGDRLRFGAFTTLVKLLGVLVALTTLLTPARAQAAPEAHILRIDPRAGVAGGAPLLSTVIEVVQMRRLSEVLQPCATISGYEKTLDCWSDELEKPNALWQRFPFPEANARLLVSVQGEDRLTKFVSKQEWGAAQKEPGVGTAWLVALDASSGMGARYGEAREIARQFIADMQPNDIMDLMIFGDTQVVHDSKWKTFAQRNDLIGVLNAQAATLPAKGSDRPLFNLVKTMTKDAFGDLGSTTGPANIPMHQAMVFLSNGAGRGDAASASPSAEVFSQYLNKGRFPEENTALPKTPLPVISIWFPTRGGLQNNIYRNNDAQFMQSLANPQIGGYFNVIREGATERGKKIIQLVRARFNAMYVVKWKLACLNPSVEQTFKLVFENTKPVIAPDATFKDVPIGVDPTQWPLDVDFERTRADAQQTPLHPGGTFRVFGEFCWGGDKQRAEAYFIPGGTKAPPNANSRDPELAKRAMQDLIRQNMRGAAVDSSDSFVTLQVPDDEKILEGTGSNMAARLIVYDNKAKRASSLDEKTVLTLRAERKPFNLLLILGIAGAVVVLLLLVLVLLRGGGGRGGKRGRAQGGPPPGQYGGPPGGYGGPPPGGGYGGPPPGGYGGPPPGGYGGPPQGGGYGGGQQMAPAHHASSASSAPPAGMQPSVGPSTPAAAPLHALVAPPDVVQVRCPACSMLTMVTPGQPSVCFSCGQPIGADLTAQGGGLPGGAQAFPFDGSARGARATPEPVRLGT